MLTDLESLKHAETLTADGRKVTLSANIEFIEELDGILAVAPRAWDFIAPNSST